MVQTQNESDVELIRLIIQYIIRRINLQHILFFLVLVTFDIGDAVTGAIMMDARGIDSEFNFIIRYVYVNHGLAGLITVKLWFIILPLMVASVVNKHSYWFLNGILVSLILAGVLAIRANLQALAGVPFMDPTEVILIYIQALVILGTAGSIIDGRIEKSSTTGNTRAVTTSH